MSLVGRISSPEDLKSLSESELTELASDLRARMIAATSVNGGHLAPSLGAVEIVLACHRVLDLPYDKLLFDVGHQSYAHKMLTGRLEGFEHLRQADGISGFTRRKESPYDVYDSGHASDSLAVALGLAAARDLKGEDRNIVTVIGDASLPGGMSLEAMNTAGMLGLKKFVIILNDNEMSISRSVGALSGYLARIRTARSYTEMRDTVEATVNSMGPVAEFMMRMGNRARKATKQMVVPGMFFEEMGFTYLGPVDGHDVVGLQDMLIRSLSLDCPVVIHAVTTKGKGYAPAEKNPGLFHGVGPFDLETGELKSKAPAPMTYTKVFGDAIVDEASHDPSIVAITAAMTDGTGLARFASAYPERFFDVGIAEECAVTMASGMAIAGLKPVVAIYSTFLQRAFDQISTNVCLPDLPVVFALDRAGLVGEDGSTHHGMFDLAYLRLLPNMSIAAPTGEAELACALHTALSMDHPVAIRYPRGSAIGEEVPTVPGDYPMHGDIVRQDSLDQARARVAILAVGRMRVNALAAAAELESRGVGAVVWDPRWVKPIDRQMVKQAAEADLIVTVEDGTVVGGFGSGVLEVMSQEDILARTLILGTPDEYVGHGRVSGLLHDCGLDADGIVNSVMAELDLPRGEA